MNSAASSPPKHTSPRQNLRKQMCKKNNTTDFLPSLLLYRTLCSDRYYVELNIEPLGTCGVPLADTGRQSWLSFVVVARLAAAYGRHWLNIPLHGGRSWVRFSVRRVSFPAGFFPSNLKIVKSELRVVSIHTSASWSTREREGSTLLAIKTMVRNAPRGETWGTKTNKILKKKLVCDLPQPG